MSGRSSIGWDLKDDRLEDVKFNTFGCVAAIAVSSMVSELAIGKKLDEVKKITNRVVAEALGGLPQNKMHCSNLGAEAMALAIKSSEDMRDGQVDSSGAGDETAGQPSHCARCGALHPANAKFCMECGQELGS